jgi:hypothetical protein
MYKVLPDAAQRHTLPHFRFKFVTIPNATTTTKKKKKMMMMRRRRRRRRRRMLIKLGQRQHFVWGVFILSLSLDTNFFIAVLRGTLHSVQNVSGCMTHIT